MKKQRFKFFILHTLARQLRNWADLASRLSEARHQANAERIDPTIDNPPAHWLSRIEVKGAPPHWLSHVTANRHSAQMRMGMQQDVPERPQQKEHTEQSIITPSLSSPAAQATKQRAHVAESMPARRDTSKQTEVGDKSGVPAPSRNVVPSLASDLPGVSMKKQPGRLANGRHRIPVENQPRKPKPNEGTEPAQSRGGPVYGAHSIYGKTLQSPHRSPEDMQRRLPHFAINDVRHDKSGIYMREEPDSVGISALRDPPRGPQPNGGPLSRFVENQAGGLMETSKGKQGKWPNQWVQAAPFSQTQNQASEDAQAALRWPSLPEDVQPAVTSTSQDWDMMRRIWERQQRLNEEQRGSSWNV